MSKTRETLENYTSEIKKEWEAYGSCMPLGMYIELRVQRLKD